jgi:hypothetical protein
MSQQGYLVWYTESDDINPYNVLRELPSIVGLQVADFVYLTDPVAEGPDDDMRELVAEHVPAANLPELYRPGTCIHVFHDFAAMGDRVEQAVLEGVPEQIRGTFVPDRPFFQVGKHYLYDNETEMVFARPTVVVGCWGYSSPKDWEGFRSRVFKLPRVHAEKVRLEHLLGRLEEAVFWHF